jgi:hypothetical protein
VLVPIFEEREMMAVGRKKTKKAVESVNSKIQLVMKSGKASLGYKTVVKALRLKQSECRAYFQ